MSNVLLLLIVALGTATLIKQYQLEKQMALDYTRIQAALAAETSATQAAISLIQQLADAVRNIPVGDDPAATQQAINDLADQFSGKAADLAKAVTDNTPAAT